MTMTNAKHVRLACITALLAASVVTALPEAAQAQRQSPLADAPAIRKRVELRARRGELGVGYGTTLGQDFYHTQFVTARLGFHLTDWLSIAAFGGFAFANVETSYHEKLNDTLKDETGTPPSRAPSEAQANASMSKIKMVGGAQLEFTPFTGKYSLFGKLFAHYDFYLLGGGGAMNVEPTGATGVALEACGATNVNRCAVSGWRPGFTAGVGMHTFFNDVVALNLELRDFIAQINPSGRDVNGDGVADKEDIGWGNTYMFAANIVFYLPTNAAISP
jgi:outer membrane beta-barrel protein